MTMKKQILKPQSSDMGCGIGEYEFDKNTTLIEFLDWFRKHINTWGVFTIINNNDNIVREFDYDLYNDTQFYHRLSGWEYNLSLRKVKFSYCFMNEDVCVYLN